MSVVESAPGSYESGSHYRHGSLISERCEVIASSLSTLSCYYVQFEHAQLSLTFVCCAVRLLLCFVDLTHERTTYPCKLFMNFSQVHKSLPQSCTTYLHVCGSVASLPRVGLFLPSALYVLGHSYTKQGLEGFLSIGPCGEKLCFSEFCMKLTDKFVYRFPAVLGVFFPYLHLPVVQFPSLRFVIRC